MNSFGRIFRIHINGESHGREVGVLIDGCPAGIPLKTADFHPDLARRRPGQSGTTARRERDTPELCSGIRGGRTTGAPLAIRFRNLDALPRDYRRFRDIPRPGHADFAAGVKFGGYNDIRGGGFFSGRMTLALVAAGVVAKKIIAPVRVGARLLEAGGDARISVAVRRAEQEGDSIGGIVECRAENLPAGLGEPFFDPLDSLVSHLAFAVPGIKGIEFGSGFALARMTGSIANDRLVDAAGRTATNHAGGVNGGISNGNPVVLRVAVRPAASIPRPQETINLKSGRLENLEVSGRHDLCIARRVPVVIAAALAIVIADLLLLEGRRPRIWSRP